ncbi:MAG: glycoside hydrolase family 95-like protein [Planctomycetota bacterium]|jgi:alpha-L-fucosidase 2
MLLYSRPDIVKLLPAIPDSWNKGKAERILCRGGLEVSLDWDMKADTIEARLKSRTAQTTTVKFPRWVSNLRADGIEAGQCRPASAGRDVSLRAELQP